MNEPIRVLHVVGNMGAGGLESLIMNWYRKIDREKVQFDFLVHYKEKAFYEEEIHRLGGKVYHCSLFNDYNVVRYYSFLRGFLNDHNEYRILHGHHSALGRFYLKAAADKEVPVRISHSHIAAYSKTVRGYVKYLITRSFGKYANVHFACSRAAGEYMYGVSDNFTVVKNGIDTKKFQYSENRRIEYRKQLNLESRLVLVHVGRFHDQKNHIFLINLLNEIVKIRKDVTLVMVGVGPLQQQIMDIVGSYNLSKYCLFLNNRSDVESILCASDVFVFPSLYEGLPLTLVEAQASGLPVVCSDTITMETKLSDDYYALSISSGYDEWVDKILALESDNRNRLEAAEKVREQGYDSSDVAEWVQNYYLRNSH